MRVRLLIIFLMVFSFLLNGQKRNVKPNSINNKIVKIEIKKELQIYDTIDRAIIEKRNYHHIEVYNDEGQIIEKRSLYENGEVFDTIRYEYDDKRREVKRIRNGAQFNRKYFTKE